MHRICLVVLFAASFLCSQASGATLAPAAGVPIAADEIPVSRPEHTAPFQLTGSLFTAPCPVRCFHAIPASLVGFYHRRIIHIPPVEYQLPPTPSDPRLLLAAGSVTTFLIFIAGLPRHPHPGGEEPDGRENGRKCLPYRRDDAALRRRHPRSCRAEAPRSAPIERRRAPREIRMSRS